MKVTADQARTEIANRVGAYKRLLSFVEYTHPRWTSGAHHRLICDALERVERGEVKRLLIEAPPRHGKSELASRRFPAWYIGRHPERQIISASYNDLLANDIGRDVRNLVREREYRNVFPDVTLAEDSMAAGRWHTAQGGAYLATGVGGTMTGYGAHLLTIDDPHKGREEADSERIRDNVWSWYTSTALTRLMPESAVVMILTRWHEDDLAARALASEHWEVLKLPAIKDGAALWPEWYPLPRLEGIRAVLPPRDWQALYQQEPRADQGTYIQREWFDERYTKPPNGLNVYIVSDFAVTEAKEGKDPDYTEHGVFGLGQDDKMYVLDWWYGQTTTDVWMEQLLRLFKKWKPSCWFGEAGTIWNAINPTLTTTMRERRIYCRTEKLTPIHDKAIRGRGFQGRAHARRVAFPVKEEWAERVINQCVAFPGGKHDDAFDVMAWMGLALDQAHPGIVRRKDAKPGQRDYGDRSEPAANGWKYA